MVAGGLDLAEVEEGLEDEEEEEEAVTTTSPVKFTSKEYKEANRQMSYNGLTNLQ